MRDGDPRGGGSIDFDITAYEYSSAHYGSIPRTATKRGVPEAVTMPARSKFTAERREAIFAGVRVGVPLASAAALAGVDRATLLRWLARGRDAGQHSLFRQFADQIEQARAEADAFAVGIVRRAMPDNPMLAWRWLERRMREDFGRDRPAPALQGPVRIQLTLSDGLPLPEDVVLPPPIVLPLPEGKDPA